MRCYAEKHMHWGWISLLAQKRARVSEKQKGEQVETFKILCPVIKGAVCERCNSFQVR